MKAKSSHEKKPVRRLSPGAPAKPGDLSPRASLEWDKLLVIIQDAGVELSPAAQPYLVLASTQLADQHRDWLFVQEHGHDYVNAKTGATVEYPAVGRIAAGRRLLVVVFRELGLSIKDADVSVAPAAPYDAMSELLKKKR